MTIVDKENSEPRNASVRTPPPPSLIPLDKKSARKSSCKKVRFSIAEESPVLSFPSEADLLGNRRSSVGKNAVSSNSGLSTPESGDSSSSSSNPVFMFLKNESNPQINVLKSSRLWDTPSRRDTTGSSPGLSVASDTPGGDERRLFQFIHQQEDQKSSSSVKFLEFFETVNQDSSIVVPPPISTPQPTRVCDDDPALIRSGGALSSSIARSRRRLSNVDAIQLEMADSVEGLQTHVQEKDTNVAHMRDIQKFFQIPNLCITLKSAPLVLLQNNYIASISLIVDAALLAMNHRMEFPNSVLNPESLSLVMDSAVSQFHSSPSAAWVECLKEALQGCRIRYRAYLGKISADLEADEQSFELVRKEMALVCEKISAEMESVREDYEKVGSLVVKPIEQIRLEDVDSAIREKEKEITNVVTDILELEAVLDNRDKKRATDKVHWRNFYFRNGWHTLKSTPKCVFVYCCCHLLVFQRAKNNCNIWRFVKMYPVKLEVNPAFAESHLVVDPKFEVPTDIGDLIDPTTCFEYSPQSFYDLMTAVTVEMCKWMRLKDRLFGLKRKLSSDNSGLTKIKINVNFQIEIVVVAENWSIDDKLLAPVMVKLLWFDNVRAAEPPNYTNCSYLVSDSTEAGFPGLRSAVEQKIQQAQSVWDSESFELLESIVCGIHEIAKSIRGSVPPSAAFIRE